jgi:hypothetical protein
VRVHLRPLERKGLIDIWADTRIQAGSLWREELRRALSAARVAILLVSAEFLASDFVQENELPVLLDAAEKGGTRVLPLIVGASRFSRVPELSKFQAVNAPDKPLAGLPVFAQDEVLERMSAAVEMALAHSQGDEQ